MKWISIIVFLSLTFFLHAQDGIPFKYPNAVSIQNPANGEDVYLSPGGAVV